MKNALIRKYLTKIGVFTAIYIPIVIIGAALNLISEVLYWFLPNHIYYTVADHRVLAAAVVYFIGVFSISIHSMVKISRLFSEAGDLIDRNINELEENVLPEELREYGRKLRDFKRKLAETELARKSAEQQKNDLIVYLAHDLKTPLTSVIGYLSLLSEASDMPIEQRAKYTGIALDKAYRLEQLINEFFDITRLNLQTLEAQKSRTNLTILLMQTLGEFYPMFEEKGIRVAQNIESELFVFADGDKLARVFDNLLRNAVNYCYPDSPLSCTAKRENGQIIVSIKNRGAEIPKEKLLRIFDKFYRLDDSRGSATGGSGLGLAIAKQIVEQHGGTITADCIDETIEFRVTLPT